MNEFIHIDRKRLFDLPPTPEQFRDMKRQRDVALTVMAILCGVVVWMAWYCGSITQ